VLRAHSGRFRLVHGITQTGLEDWDWNYVPALTNAGIDVCTVGLPDRALTDIQISAEYVVYAVRQMRDERGFAAALAWPGSSNMPPVLTDSQLFANPIPENLIVITPKRSGYSDSCDWLGLQASSSARPAINEARPSPRTTLAIRCDTVLRLIRSDGQ